MSAHSRDPGARPPSDVSAGVGLAGLLGLLAWILICRNWPALAEAFALPGPHARLDGPYAALTAMLFTTAPMVAWSV